MAPADQATALSATSSSSIWRRSRFPQLDEAAVTCGEARRRQAAEDALVASTLDLVAGVGVDGTVEGDAKRYRQLISRHNPPLPLGLHRW